MTADKKKISLWQRLREKYRISVLDEHTLTEHWHLHLNGWGAIVVVATLFLLSLALFSLVILYTPIRNYLPGYSENIRQQLITESARVDSLGTSLELQRQYLEIIKQVVAGEAHTDTVQSLDSMQIIMREQLLEAKQAATEEFIAQYEAMGKDNMQLFLTNPGRVFTREQLLLTVWGDDFLGETRTVDVHIGTLRAKLGAEGDCIETVRGVGYRLEVPV